MISEFISQIESEFKANENEFLEIEGASNFVKFLIAKPNIKIGIATGGWEK